MTLRRNHALDTCRSFRQRGAAKALSLGAIMVLPHVVAVHGRAAGDWYHVAMARTRNPLQPLGELEAAVLNALWDEGELSTPAAYEHVGTPRGLSYTTILTVLQRLTAKRLVARRGGGRSHLYSAAMTREEFAERRAESLAAALVDLGAAGVGAFLAEASRLDPQMVDTLRSKLRTRR